MGGYALSRRGAVSLFVLTVQLNRILVDLVSGFVVGLLYVLCYDVEIESYASFEAAVLFREDYVDVVLLQVLYRT